MIDWTNLALPFLQTGSVARRLNGVSDRFSDSGAANAQFLSPLLIALGLLLLTLVAYRAWNWRRFFLAFGKSGFGLTSKEIRAIWRLSDAWTRREPRKFLASRERLAGFLEKLAQSNERQLLVELLSSYISRSPETRQPEKGIENLVQLERIRLHRKDGLIIEGFLRRAGQMAIDFVALEVPIQIPEVDEAFRIERACGERLDSLALRVDSLNGPWTFSIGEQAAYGHRRDEFRISIDLEGLVLPAHVRLQAIREEMLNPTISEHPILAKHQNENPQTIEDHLAKGKLFRRAEVFRFDDLSALGARFRIAEPNQNLSVERPIFLYMPFVVAGRREEHFVSAVVVETWQTPAAKGRIETVVRCRFMDIQDDEIRNMRGVINRLASANRSYISMASQMLLDHCGQPSR